MKTKYFLLFFSLFAYLHLAAQVKYGILEYAVTVGTDNLFESFDKKLADEYRKDKESEKYVLEFDTEKAIFINEGGFTISGSENSPIIYYKEKDSLFSLRPIDDEDFGKLIIKENRDTKWTLCNESKMIGNYKCYKATSNYKIELEDNEYNTFPIVAWYAPSIPMPFGPLGYGNLPGLILELHERIDIYGVTKISLNPKKNNQKSMLKKPLIGKIISREELNQKIKVLFEKKI